MPPIFTELAARGAGLSDLLKRAQETAAVVTKVLDEAISSRKKIEFLIAAEEGREEIKGTVLESGSVAFKLKLSGKTTTRDFQWRDLTVPTLAQLAGVTEGEAALLIGLLGELDRAIAFAGALAPKPEWLASAARLADIMRWSQISRLQQECESLVSGKHWPELLVAVDELVGLLSEAELTEQRQRLSGWLHDYWISLGPGAAFPGASETAWDADSGVLTLPYQFTDESALSDWGTGPASQCEVKRRMLRVQGSLMLTPAEMWNQQGGSSIFEKDLDVKLVAKAANRVAPNINVVLWAQRGRPNLGVLAGLGFKPPGRFQVVNQEGVEFLTPANVLGAVRELEKRAPKGLFVDIKPKVGSGTIQLQVNGNGDQFQMGFAKGTTETYTVSFTGDPQGTVELRTYVSVVAVRSLTIRGKVRDAWFRAWRDLQVAKQLVPRR